MKDFDFRQKSMGDLLFPSLKLHNRYYHSVHPPAMSHGITFSCLTSVTKACSTFSMRSMLHSHRVPRSSSSEQSNCSKVEMNPRKITPFKTWNKSEEKCHFKLLKTNLLIFYFLFSMRSMLHLHQLPRSSSSELVWRQSNHTIQNVNSRKITPIKT